MTTLTILSALDILKTEKDDAYKAYEEASENWDKRLRKIPPVQIKEEEPSYIAYVASIKRLDKATRTLSSFEQKEWT